jgi:hypothetical protein
LVLEHFEHHLHQRIDLIDTFCSWPDKEPKQITNRHSPVGFSLVVSLFAASYTPFIVGRIEQPLGAIINDEEVPEDTECESNHAHRGLLAWPLVIDQTKSLSRLQKGPGCLFEEGSQRRNLVGVPS